MNKKNLCLTLTALSMFSTAICAGVQEDDALEALRDLSMEMENLEEVARHHQLQLEEIHQAMERLAMHRGEIEDHLEQRGRFRESADRDEGFDLGHLQEMMSHMGGHGQIVIERRGVGPDGHDVDRRVIDIDLADLDLSQASDIHEFIARTVSQSDEGSQVEVSVQIVSDEEGGWPQEHMAQRVRRNDDARHDGDRRHRAPQGSPHHAQREAAHGSHGQWDQDPGDSGQWVVRNRFEGQQMPPILHPDMLGGHTNDIGMRIWGLHEAQMVDGRMPGHAVAMIDGRQMQVGHMDHGDHHDQDPGDEMLEKMDRMEEFAHQLQRGDRMAILGISLTQDLLGPAERINALKHFLGNNTYTLVARNAAALVIINALVELGETEQAQGLLTRFIATNAAATYPPAATAETATESSSSSE